MGNRRLTVQSVDQTPDGTVILTRRRAGEVVGTWTGKRAAAKLRRQRLAAHLERIVFLPLAVVVGLPMTLLNDRRQRAWMRRCDLDPALQCVHGTPEYAMCWECVKDAAPGH